MDQVAAVVVTYNRKELFAECLTAILNQTRHVDDIVVIDNASTDGTPDVIKAQGYLTHPRFHYLRMKKNLGGAGGFYKGIQYAHQLSTDWLWIMDDDTIPDADCLENLLKAKEELQHERISYLASAIYGLNNECMNVPTLDTRAEVNGYSGWYRHLSAGIMNIRSATFVSILINNDAVSQCGLPCKDYFIWGDDGEYTLRLTTYYGKAYFIGSSVAIHKRAIAKSLDISNETDPKRIRMFWYYFRNNGINDRFYQLKSHTVLRQLFNCIGSIKYLKEENGFWKMLASVKGSFFALIQYSKFESYIKDQLGKMNC